MSEDENEIMLDIRRARADLDHESGYDVHVMFEKMRAETARLEQEGWTIVRREPSATEALVREVPPVLRTSSEERPMEPAGAEDYSAINEENEILSEIRRGREEHARAQNYDVHALFEEMRQDTERLKAEGWKFVDFSDQPPEALVREDPPSG